MDLLWNPPVSMSTHTNNDANEHALTGSHSLSAPGAAGYNPDKTGFQAAPGAHSHEIQMGASQPRSLTVVTPPASCWPYESCLAVSPDASCSSSLIEAFVPDSLSPPAARSL
ncbi:hypothetical protein CKAH01_03472 [Colletotrichum kahawae]|uniref:Uncharacterized protein n=1 Tax=Colletotrichum kahawae TaxID=34407 RepID=A0AAD9YUD3_COLKA|nr:hypothetical protein CKAH01_03472 [Colletotrichum kahawae]